MRQMWQRAGSLTCVLLGMGAACANGAGAQGVPTERSVSPPNVEWNHRGFTAITSVRELDDRRVLVADRGERNLYVVNPESGAVDQLLRRGDGPGEYQQIGWLYAVGDNETLLTTIVGRRWILLRDTDAVRTFTGSAPLNWRFRSRLDGVSSSGGVLSSVSVQSPGNSIAEERVLELAPGFGPHDELPRLDTIRFVRGGGMGQLGCVLAGGAGACYFLEAEEQAILFPDGWIAVAFQDPYRVDWRSPDGEWTRGEVLARDPVPTSEAEKCAAINGWTEGECDAAEVASYRWQHTMPPFLTDARSCRACTRLPAGRAPWLFADPHGRLVVRRTPQRSRRDNVYDIVDRSGRVVERVTLPPEQAIVGFGESSLYTIRMDEYDLQWLQRHAWRD